MYDQNEKHSISKAALRGSSHKLKKLVNNQVTFSRELSHLLVTCKTSMRNYSKRLDATWNESLPVGGISEGYYKQSTSASKEGLIYAGAERREDDSNTSHQTKT